MLLLLVANLFVLLLALVAAATWGSRRWGRAGANLHAVLEAGRRPVSPATFDPAEIAELPAPVQRYFRTVLTPGQPLVSSVRVGHRGTFNTGATKARWRPFTSTQFVVTRRPGFLWSARVAMATGMPVLVHDAYLAGEGILHATLLGFLPLAEVRGTPEAAQGELMRFLAEAVWYPTALLPSQGVRWEGIDDTTSRATLGDGDTCVALAFTFDGEGLVRRVRAEGRYRTVGAEAIPTPWEGRFSDYQQRGGMRVPLEGEVAWLLPDGPWPYWRGRMTELDFTFAPIP